MDKTLTASLRKAVASLATAKGRKSLGLFTAQGTRCVADTMPHLPCRYLFATAAWLDEHPAVRPAGGGEVIQVSQADIQRMSDQRSPQPVMAVYEIPRPEPWSYDGRLTLALDCVQDPGNLGTIVRLADWFGVEHILAAPGTADLYNPKVVQATMGALCRVKVHYVDSLADALERSGAPVVGTFLDGRNLYGSELPLERGPIVVMGNEGNGISEEVAAVVTHRVLIPSFPPGRQGVESLNVATATAIVISEISRRIYG